MLLLGCVYLHGGQHQWRTHQPRESDKEGGWGLQQHVAHCLRAANVFPLHKCHPLLKPVACRLCYARHQPFCVLFLLCTAGCDVQHLHLWLLPGLAQLPVCGDAGETLFCMQCWRAHPSPLLSNCLLHPLPLTRRRPLARGTGARCDLWLPVGKCLDTI